MVVFAVFREFRGFLSDKTVTTEVTTTLRKSGGNIVAKDDETPLTSSKNILTGFAPLVILNSYMLLTLTEWDQK